MSFSDFLDSISYATSTPAERAQMIANKSSLLDLQKKQAAQSAESRLVGGTDPLDGAGGNINWNPTPPPTGNTTLLGGSVPGQPNDQTVPTGQVGGLLGTAAPPSLLNSSPQAPQGDAVYNNSRAQLLAQADPDAAIKNAVAIQSRNASMNAIKSLGLPADVTQAMSVEVLGAPEVAKGLTANMQLDPTVKTIKGFSDLIAAKGGPDSPEAAPYVKGLSNTLQNVEGGKLAELIRNDSVTAALNAIDIQASPDGTGFVRINKLTGQSDNLGAPTPPPNQQPFSSPYIKTLAPDAQQRFSQVNPSLQPLVSQILSGALQPPENGKAITDPKTRNLLTQAIQVDPSFNEQVWRARNDANKDMAASTPNSFGGQRIAAQTLIGHLTGLLDSAADNNNASSLGSLGNSAANTGVQYTSPGTIGNSAAKKAALENFNVHKIGVGEEGTKIMSGSAGTDTAKADMEERFSPDADISSTVGSVGALADMMRQRVQSQLDKYNGIMRTNMTPEDILGPKASAQYKALQQISQDAKSGKPITPQYVKQVLSKLGNGLPPGMVSKVGTLNGKPVYVDAQGKRHVEQ